MHYVRRGDLEHGFMTDNGMERVPEVRRLRLRNVETWRDLDMEFIPGLNIITDEGRRGSDKSEILRAVFQAFKEPAYWGMRLTPGQGAKEGEISLELASAVISCRVGGVKRHDYDQGKALRSGGALSLFILGEAVRETPQGQALLIDDDVWGSLDDETFGQAMRILEEAKCQVVIALGRRHLERTNLSRARVFCCRNTTESSIDLERPGEGARPAP